MENVKVAFLGFGNVGTGAYKIINQNNDEIKRSEAVRLEVSKILVRDINKKRALDVGDSVLTDKIEEIVNDPEISIVAEFIGGVDPAKDYVLSCLQSKKSVATANKELIAKHG